MQEYFLTNICYFPINDNFESGKCNLVSGASCLLDIKIDIFAAFLISKGQEALGTRL